MIVQNYFSRLWGNSHPTLVNTYLYSSSSFICIISFYIFRTSIRTGFIQRGSLWHWPVANRLPAMIRIWQSKYLQFGVNWQINVCWKAGHSDDRSTSCLKRRFIMKVIWCVLRIWLAILSHCYYLWCCYFAASWYFNLLLSVDGTDIVQVLSGNSMLMHTVNILFF